MKGDMYLMFTNNNIFIVMLSKVVRKHRKWARKSAVGARRFWGFNPNYPDSNYPNYPITLITLASFTLITFHCQD